MLSDMSVLLWTGGSIKVCRNPSLYNEARAAEGLETGERVPTAADYIAAHAELSAGALSARPTPCRLWRGMRMRIQDVPSVGDILDLTMSSWSKSRSIGEMFSQIERQDEGPENPHVSVLLSMDTERGVEIVGGAFPCEQEVLLSARCVVRTATLTSMPVMFENDDEAGELPVWELTCFIESGRSPGAPCPEKGVGQ